MVSSNAVSTERKPQRMANDPISILNPILSQYYETYGSRITQESEKLFVDEFLFPLLGKNLQKIIPQHPFLDSTGRSRRIDFAYVDDGAKLAMEVNGETYHAEGVIGNDTFDQNLFRQNEILSIGYK